MDEPTRDGGDPPERPAAVRPARSPRSRAADGSESAPGEAPSPASSPGPEPAPEPEPVRDYVELETVGRDVTGPSVHGVAARPQRAHFLSVVSLRVVANVFAVLLAALLVTSILATIWRSIRLDGPTGGLGMSHYVAVLSDQTMRAALLRSGLWAAVAVGVALLGLIVAALGRFVGDASRLLTLPLLIPLAASMLVTGAAFRLLVDPDPDRGMISAVAVAGYEALADPAPAGGARPDETAPEESRLYDQGDLVTTFNYRAGCHVDLRVVTPREAPEPRPGSPESSDETSDRDPVSCVDPDSQPPNRITGTLHDQSGALPGVTVRADAFGIDPVETVTDDRGRFAVELGPAGATESVDHRLIIPERSTTPPWPGPQPYRAEVIWIPLVLAFTWAWLGFAVSLFRTRLNVIPPDLVRVAKAEGLRPLHRLTRVIVPLLRPVITVVLLTLMVAAVRLFDLMLVMVPGPLQADVEVGALLWWRSPEATPGERAAMATLLFGMVAVVALGAVWGVRQARGVTSVILPVPAPAERVPLIGPPMRQRTLLRRSIAVLLGLLGLIWLSPLIVLVGTSLRSPADAALTGFWNGGIDGLGLASFRAALDNGLIGALGASLFMAGTTALLVAVIAGSVGHALAWSVAGPRLVSAVVIVLALLAVAPVQLYAAPMAEWFAATNLTGTSLNLALILAHTAAGLPFAILLMRGAFLTTSSPLDQTLTGEIDRQAEGLGLIRRHWDAVVAVAVLEFVLVWNDLVMGLLLGGTPASPLTLLLWGELRWFHTSAGPIAAAAVFSLIVPLIVLGLGWRTAVRGLTGVRRRAGR
ncbi:MULTISPECIES: ABC transporter permease subunit [Actinoalloteichus]|uniref:ABC-type sugar transport system, permease component n=1 Tax=Actinoalloteichus fjordicus TaxID=1612552 RepID=A0AAC9LC45_9PSEU|nr:MULTISPECIES: ABC transporter permease subunit [Actinoalloteichus]APU13705.1 ABC-type sugar transport system, permease component [Actinoalloteichus fjordicus]APU19651.1 ABC-type sugar transport system, permease component [Actinoalloteichus sp. GBA129-24]